MPQRKDSESQSGDKVITFHTHIVRCSKHWVTGGCVAGCNLEQYLNWDKRNLCTYFLTSLHGNMQKITEMPPPPPHHSICCWCCWKDWLYSSGFFCLQSNIEKGEKKNCSSKWCSWSFWSWVFSTFLSKLVGHLPASMWFIYSVYCELGPVMSKESFMQ